MAEDQPHILVVDDDSRLRDLLRRYLSDNGFRVSMAGDAAAARTQLNSVDFDLIVLDVMMPGETGVQFTRTLRQESAVPILMLTAMGEAEDRIDGLESGADDYLAKPFEPRELLLRIRTVLRRSRGPAPVEAPARRHVRFGGFVFDLGRGELFRGHARVRLTDVERSPLASLAEAADAALTREDLVARSAVNGNMRTIDVQITRLRRKIETDPKFPRYLQTVRGKGYMLRTEG